MLLELFITSVIPFFLLMHLLWMFLQSIVSLWFLTWTEFYLLETHPISFFFLFYIFKCMFMWSGVLMKSMTSKWSSLIFLMAGPLSWLSDPVNNCGPWSSQIIMSTHSLHLDTHTYTHIHNQRHGPDALLQLSKCPSTSKLGNTS